MNVDAPEGKALRSFELATHRMNIWEGAVRSGKTIVSLLAWIRFVIDGPPGNLLMVGKTERTLKRNVVDPLTEILHPKRCRMNTGTGELALLGRRVYVAGANDERSQDRIRGLTLAGAYADEASTFPESFWSMLLTRLSVADARMYATTNPDSPTHWLKRDYLDRTAVWLRHDGEVQGQDTRILNANTLDLARFSFRLADNPTLPAAYVANLSREFTGLWRRRFIEGLWVLAEGSIFDAFDPDPGAGIVIPSLPPMTGRWWLCVDHGTVNPFVALLVGLSVDGRLVVAREWRHDSRRAGHQMTDAAYAEALRSWLGPVAIEPERVFVDPSAASFAAQLWSDGWAGVTPADNRVDDGLRSVASLIGGRHLVIHDSCSGLIDEMAGYVWDPKAAARGTEQPLKVADHGPDALRYGVMGLRNVWRHWLAAPVADAA